MSTGTFRSGLVNAAFVSLGVFLAAAGEARAQAPAKTKLKKILVLDKSQGGAGGHFESRRDLNAANVAHDAEGTKDGTETKGIFKGLTAPLAFLDEYYSFRATPRGKAGVSILLTVDEASFSKPVRGPMGNDHPVVWAKTAKNSYLKNFLYGTLRYVAGDFLGSTDPKYSEFNPDATKSDPSACATVSTSFLPGAERRANALYSRSNGKASIDVSVPSNGSHAVYLYDMAGRPFATLRGTGPSEYSLPKPSRSGLYLVLVRAGGQESRHRITVL